MKKFFEFQLGVAKTQFKVSFLNFEVSNQSFKVRALMNRFDYKNKCHSVEDGMAAHV